MLSASSLTEEQRAIVQHADGPALVFAVAGAGKTTSMVHRIRRLVQDADVPPSQILASSFSRATVDDLGQALDALHVRGVEVRTLHSLGLQVIRKAEQRGLLPPRSQRQEESPGTLAQILASRALTRLAIERDLDTHELGIDRDELLDQIAAWKQQLAYPNLDAASLPPDADGVASQAEHDNDDVLTLYRYYEQMRREEGWLTFDDMLVEGWESLLRFDDIRAAMQAQYRHVLVDEFQDVSRVQFLILDILTAPHRNYMAIGDDDQCIYEWRGADPSFILDFPERYDAETYVISDNFRSTAAQVSLANAVIEQNETRYEKSLHLTRGFDGTTQRLAADGPRDEAERIVDALQTHREDGRSLREMSVLVRTYAQTPFLESALINRGIDYRIVGHVPFYRRREVQTLLRYLFWATLEADLQENGWFERRRDASRYVDRFARILKEPNRYVKHDTIDQIGQQAVRQQTSVLDVLTASLNSVHNRTADRVRDFLDTCEGLLARLDQPAKETLQWLMDDLDYASYLRKRSAIAEVGEARVRTARSLVAFAEGHPSAASLLDEIVTLSRHRRGAGSPDGEEAGAEVLEIRSIHRAKGLEWPIVVVPGCNDGTLPQRRTRTDRSRRRVTSFDEFLNRNADEPDEDEPLPVDLEEERRLLYVAITRAQRHLILSYDETNDRSPFLDDANVDVLCDTAQTVRRRLQTDPASWSDADVVDLCCGIDTLGIERYFATWWDADAEVREAVRFRLDEMRAVREEAKADVEAYADAVTEWEEEYAATVADEGRERPYDDANTILSELRDLLGTAALPVAHDAPETYYDAGATFTFRWTGDGVDVYHDGARVGEIALFQSSRLTPDVALRLPWNVLVASFARVGKGRDMLYVSLDYTATRRALRSAAADEAADRVESSSVPPEPDEPDAETQRLAGAAFQRGFAALMDACMTSVQAVEAQ